MNVADRFPILSAGLPVAQRGLFATQVAELYAALDRGQLSRRRQASLKADLTRRIEAAYTSVLLPHCTQPGVLSRAEHKVETTIFDITPTIATLGQVITRIEAIYTTHPIQRAALSLLYEALALATVFEALRDGDMIHDAAVSPIDTETVAVPARVALGGSSRSLVSALLHRAVEQERDALLARLAAEMPTYLPGHAENEADSLQVQFTTKTRRKLINLLDAKITVHRVALVRSDLTLRRTSTPGIDATLRFEFADGAVCAARNTAIMKVSVYGRVFWQVSLAYVSARLPDGTTLTRPSERQITDAFLARQQREPDPTQSLALAHQTD